MSEELESVSVTLNKMGTAAGDLASLKLHGGWLVTVHTMTEYFEAHGFPHDEAKARAVTVRDGYRSLQRKIDELCNELGEVQDLVRRQIDHAHAQKKYVNR